MTLHIKPHSFQGSRELTQQLASVANSNNVYNNSRYFLQVSIQGQLMKSFQLQQSKLRYVELSSSDQPQHQQNKQWLPITVSQHSIQIKLIVQDKTTRQYQTISTLLLTKQQLINDNNINNNNINNNNININNNNNNIDSSTLITSKKNLSPNIAKNNIIRCHYMFQNHSKINLLLKYNPYKRVIKSIKNDIGMISGLGMLKQQQKLQKDQINNRSQYNYYPAQKQPITIVSQQNRQNKQKDSSPLQPTNPQQLYIGPCQNKNIFSILDPSVKDQKYKIVEPSYQ